MDKNMTLSSDQFLYIIIGALVFLGLYMLIAYMEEVNKIKELRNENKLEQIGIGVIITVVLYACYKLLNNSQLFLFIVIALRVSLAFLTSKNAAYNGRNKVLWFFLGLLSSSIAFITLGLSSKLASGSKEELAAINQVNEKFKSDIAKLEQLKSSGLIDQAEFEQKKSELMNSSDETQSSKLQDLSGAKEQDNQKELLLKLEDAFESGLLTQDEFEKKKKSILGST